MIPLQSFPKTLVAAATPFAQPDGAVTIPVVERIEALWPYRLPSWFHAIPSKPACDWARPDGTRLPRYPELIVRDLLESRGGWNAAWAKNFSRRAFWSNLDRSGPVVAPLPIGAARLIAAVDAEVLASRRAEGMRPQTAPGGCWDVFAWRRGPRYLFLECKAPGEPFKESQLRWLGAALSVGVPLNAFAVVQHRIPKRAA
jgi:hypothetical protein